MYFGNIVALTDQVVKAENNVHGASDLMGHIRQKYLLGLIGLLCPFRVNYEFFVLFFESRWRRICSNDLNSDYTPL